MTLLPIILVVFLAIFLLFLILKDFGAISKKQKFLSLFALLTFGILIGIYAYNKSQMDKKVYLLQMSFLRGENLSCGKNLISVKDFNLSTGTLTLIGKENSPARNIVYSLKDCDLTKKTSPALENLQEQLEKD
ncbi:hypothetical protein [Helicobacter mustelae]|uniref:Uncharacterized protein n=1 Tax=Helicobacter mustelae (strain ATCC 43772 / CCUG 25715 / CIP 103759 / LMG 18044 / NCTC 12198 / R85-136P) TaxID=679897 RepID=D3UIQ4_HELM1|nr:hypothetical protein [Helicobacter mustelae]CBG40379.1 Putative hypothetical protein [Helicobacter mustelae 12198]SQH71878.1 membrane protein [Helicobacter mustelae]STP13018.1 membrane protein [Helicobacter mustelae]